jgi:peptidoglycan hydrolase-like protein with peptidoglycan-binding domain
MHRAHRVRRVRFATALAVASAFVISGCAGAQDAAQVETVDVTVALGPGQGISIDGDIDSAPSSTQPPTTLPAVTEPPVTQAPTTTTTEPAPTTTKPRPKKTTTTTSPVPLRAVAAPDTPFVAVSRSSGPETARIQQRLLDLGYWNAGADGTYGLTTTQAVMAFQKYMGLDSSGSVDQATADALARVGERPRGLSTAGDLIEIDKQRQLLFVIRNGLTELVLNTSTGDGEEYTEPDKNTPGEIITGVSLTPNGLYRVDRERPEGWWEGDLGEIYRPKYFRGGIAVHGSNSIPNYPASHGCVRVSVPAMDMIWQFDVMPMWSTVWVHEGI